MAATWTARQSSQSSGSRRTLIISLAFGLLSAFLVYRLVNSGHGGGSAGAEAAVLVARQDIPARTIVTAEMVGLKQVPVSLKLASTFTDAKPVVGKAAKAQIKAGEQVVAERLANDTKELGFAGTVPEGMRAISITVTEVATDGGLIQPGDQADVIGVFRVYDAQNGLALFGKADQDKPQHLVAETLIPSATVLAIAQAAQDGAVAPAVGKVAGQKGYAEAKTVTIAVAPEDAPRIALADLLGTLRLAVHRFNEPDAQPIPQVDNSAQSLLGTGAATNARPSGTPQPAAPSR